MSKTPPFDYEARARDIQAALERVREARQHPTSKLRRRRGHDGAKQLAEALSALETARANAFPPGFQEDFERLRNRDPSGTESAILFLEADPWFSYAGFTKTHLLRGLGRVPLDPSQQERLRDVMVQVVCGRSRMEFTDYCRFARKIYSPRLQSRLEELSNDADPAVSSKAQKMLFFCENGRWPE